jgi:CheY-like chemotaxis protein
MTITRADVVRRLVAKSIWPRSERTIRDSLGIPSIFVTAHDDAATIGQAMAARTVGFVTKPYTSREITAALAEALSSPHGLC